MKMQSVHNGQRKNLPTEDMHPQVEVGVDSRHLPFGKLLQNCRYRRCLVEVSWSWNTSGKHLTSGILGVCKLENIIKTFNIMAVVYMTVVLLFIIMVCLKKVCFVNLFLLSSCSPLSSCFLPLHSTPSCSSLHSPPLTHLLCAPSLTLTSLVLPSLMLPPLFCHTLSLTLL
jgi:hypothetical protein